MAAAERKPVINEAVCENCGDCSAQSGCIAIEPVETELGRKRRINPTSCNVDLSCLKGFCPSFVTVAAGTEKASSDAGWRDREAELSADLPEPDPASVPLPWRGLFAGIGGGGIVTAGAIVAHAAALEGWAVSTLDFTGLAQKNGAVVSHVQIGRAGQLDVVRIPLAEADMLLAADLAVAAGTAVLDRCAPDAAVVGNMDLAATAAFKTDAWMRIDAGLHRRAIEAQTGPERSRYLRAQSVAEKLFGQAQAMNTLLLGMAWQLGRVPVSRAALLQAIEYNGAAVAMNLSAFQWGRILAERPSLADEILAGERHAPPPAGLAALIELRAAHLAAYQDAAWADLYRARVAEAERAETAAVGRPGRFARSAAEGWFRAMSPKDEYEVARLHAASSYAPGARPMFHMAPPLITRVDPATGRRRKIGVPGWLALPLFRALRHGKALRGTRLDLFALQADRRMERALLERHAADMAMLCETLRPETLDAAAELAALPDRVRGYGPVKEAQLRAASVRREALLAEVGRAEAMHAA
jgi:indolepyruvate ferredoxin oxidoreductase